MPNRWVSVTGSRTYPVTKEQHDLLPVEDQLDAMAKGVALVEFNIEQFPMDFGVVSGGAKGPDEWAVTAAQERGLEVAIYEPDYEKYGRTAPLQRNTLIAKHADSCLVFWDGVSRGTQDFLRKAFKLRREIWVIGPSGTPWAIWDADFWATVGPDKNPRMDMPKG